ncbi:MAG: GNAT family N-acetyltransferase [Opitutaceae bacterium]
MFTAVEDRPPTAPAETPWGGRRYRLRSLTPGDASILIGFFESHTSETIRQRYGYGQGSMSARTAAALVGVDQTRDLALGIFERAAPEELLHGVGRYCLDPGGRSAEFALVVRESRRRHGLGSLLLRTLILTARRRGLAALWGQIETTNGAMLALARRFGFRLDPEIGGRAKRATLALQAPDRFRARSRRGRNPAGGGSATPALARIATDPVGAAWARTADAAPCPRTGECKKSALGP